MTEVYSTSAIALEITQIVAAFVIVCYVIGAAIRDTIEHHRMVQRYKRIGKAIDRLEQELFPNRRTTLLSTVTIYNHKSTIVKEKSP